MHRSEGERNKEELVEIPQRIHILGGPGSGKTTLAKLISEQLHYPHTELDILRFQNDRPGKRSFQEKEQLVKELAQKSKWVSEGVYVGWTTEMLDRAQEVVYLDLPIHISLPRVIKRAIESRIQGDNRYELKKDVKLLRWTVRYHANKDEQSIDEDRNITRKQTLDILQKYQDKLVVLKNQKDVENYLTRLGIIDGPEKDK